MTGGELLLALMALSQEDLAKHVYIEGGYDGDGYGYGLLGAVYVDYQEINLNRSYY